MISNDVLAPERAYDLASSRYDAWTWQRFWDDVEFPVVRDIVEAHPKADTPAILDLGCGTGRYLGRLAPSFPTAVGVDISEGMLRVARTNVPKADFLKADLLDACLPDQAFDVVISCRVLTHVEGLRPAFSVIERALAPGGIAVVTNIDADHRYGNTRLPTDRGDVFTTTVKHTSDEMAVAAAACGLKRTRCVFLSVHGDVYEADSRPDWDESVVSSIMVYRRGKSGLV